MKRFVVVIACIVALCARTAAGEKPLGAEEITSLDALVAEIAAYFPRVQAEVKEVQGDRLTIGLGSKDGLQAGVLLTLWREGKEIVHPVTGAVIGRAEDEVGAAEVVSLAESSSQAVIRKKVFDPRKGDKARITPKKIDLAVVPVRSDRPEVVDSIADRLKEIGRFSVLDKDTVAAFMKDRQKLDGALVRDLSKAHHLEVVAAIGVYPADGGKLVVTTKLFYADDAKPLDTLVSLVDVRTKRDALGDVKPFFAPTKEETSAVTDLQFDARLFVMADMDGKGSSQYIFSDGKKLHIHRLGITGWREEWTEPVLPNAGEIQQFSLDAADINGNGRPELFVTAMENGKVVSHVIEFRDGMYQRIADIPGFLHVLSAPGKGRILVGQDYNQNTFFAGKPKQYAWADGKYVPGAELPLPAGVGLYGFVYAAMGEANPFLIALDDKDQLRVYSDSTIIWKSEEKYPAIGIAVAKPVTGIDEMLSSTVSDYSKKPRVRIPGRLMAMDLNNDGREEIVLPKNGGESLLKGYTQAEFVALGWTGARLEQRWSVKDVSGAVLDYQIVQGKDTGMQITALIMIPGGLLKKDILRVMSYTVK